MAKQIEAGLKIKAGVEGAETLRQLADEIEAMGGDTAQLREQSKSLGEAWQRVAAQQALIARFRELKTESRGLADELAATQANINTLAQRMQADPSAALRRQFDAATQKAARLKDKQSELQQSLQRVRNEMRAAEQPTSRLTDNSLQNIKPGTLRLGWSHNGSKSATDSNGALSGDVQGAVDYAQGIITLQNAPNAAYSVTADVYTEQRTVKQYYGRTPAAPVKPQSFTVYAEAAGHTRTGTSQADESITGEITGHIDTETGFFRVACTEVFAPESLRFNVVSQSYIPLDSSIIGIDAVRLPPDGKVPIFRRGDMIVIGNKRSHDLGSAHSAGQTVSLGRADIDRASVVDAAGVHVDAGKYDIDLRQGKLTWADPLDLSGHTMPLTAHTAQEEENRVVNVDISGRLKLQFQVARVYPKEGTYVSSALVAGDLLVRHTAPFAMQSWGRKWLDRADSDPILAKLNVKDYPIKLVSAGAITERWLILFDSDSQFKLYGEHLGLVLQGDTLNDLAPANPATGKPYFTLPKFAFGGGWMAGNCVRFNTFGTPWPIWILRAVQPSPTAQKTKDGFTGCLRGNTVDI